MPIKIYVAGKICSGKSTLAKEIASFTGYQVISFGTIIKEYLVQNGQPVTREILQSAGQELINQFGYDGFLRWSIEHSSKSRWNSSLIVDGLRHAGIYRCLLDMFPLSLLVYCDCSPTTQLKRIITRDHISANEAQGILCHETEQHISELNPLANLCFQAEDSIETFLLRLDKLIKLHQT